MAAEADRVIRDNMAAAANAVRVRGVAWDKALYGSLSRRGQSAWGGAGPARSH